ncbi:MAG: ferritin [Alphaproteobacteria bacterium]|nr:ferritin [Alphaproteobacteria bacterium]
MDKDLYRAMNSQITREYQAFYLYTQMAFWLESQEYEGMARWFEKQAAEEMKHARKIAKHLIDRGEKVTLEAVERPTSSWPTPVELLNDAYNHEVSVTKTINGLIKMAQDKSDMAAVGMLFWFIDEQIEEEDQSMRFFELGKRLAQSTLGLYELDRDMGKRRDEELEGHGEKSN